MQTFVNGDGGSSCPVRPKLGAVGPIVIQYDKNTSPRPLSNATESATPN